MQTRSRLRDVNRQALDASASAVVSACAGSGKTWLLVSRIVRLLLAGVAPSQILAITFTRKAAQEMAGRLRDWLRLLATQDDAGVREFLDQRELPGASIDASLARARELFECVLTAEPPITITTFHSWFLQLLRNAPLEAGAFGTVRLVDRTSSLRDEAWERLMASCRDSPQGAATLAIQALFRDFGLANTRRLLDNFVARRAQWWACAGTGEGAVERALAEIERTLAVAPHVDVIEALIRDTAFVADVRALAELLVHCGADHCKRADAMLGALTAADAHAAFEAICSAAFRKDGVPRRLSATRALLDFAGADADARLKRCHAAVTARIEAARCALNDQRSYRINQAGLGAGATLLEHFQAVKRERQVVDFADVEWLAFALLNRSEHAVTMQFRLDSRYRHILLDEFQDTNPLQWLALRAWLDAAQQAGEAPGLFIVGDRKQSIYRFRGAEPELFDAAAAFVENRGGRRLSQDESFRCAPAVLDVVNRLFGEQQLFQPYDDHVPHHRQLPGRVEVQALAQRDALASIAAPPGSSDLRDPLRAPFVAAEDLRRANEARTFAARVREIAATWSLTDPRTGAVRPARYGDVMALVRRRTHLAIYERALRSAGIPYITSRQGGLLDTLEAEDLSALLQFLVSPFDDLRLAHALRSPIFSLADEDLIAIAGAAGRTWWDRLMMLAEAGGNAAIERAAALLVRWRERADTQPVHDQLDRIYFEGDIVSRYVAAAPPAMRAAVAANLQAYIQHALDADSGRYPSLPRFIAELRELRSAPVEEAPDEGILGLYGDSVRILTIHGAKGLEAPIVWLLDAAAPRTADGGYDALVDWPPGAGAPASFSLWTRVKERSLHQQRLAAAEDVRARREDLNALYVAMTRAQQALIVSGCEVAGWQDSWYVLVRSAVGRLSGEDPEQVATVIAHGDDLASSPRAQDEAAGRSVAARATNPFAAAHAAMPTGTRKAIVQGRGLAFGTAFHRLMERLAAEPTRSADSLRRQLRLPKQGFDVLWAQARTLLGDPALGRFFHPALHRRALSELPILTATGELRRLDRVVEFDDEVWVLDYKTGSHANVAGTALETEYRAQIEDYCAALRSVYRGRIVRGALLFADGSRIEI